VDQAAYTQKWERAALFADTVLQNIDKKEGLGKGKFGSFGTFYGVKAADLAAFTGSTTPAEFIWRKFFTNNNIETQHYPPFYYGKANTQPTQNLVDAFPMKNGYPITDAANSGYVSQNPYVNRDNRFLMCICYHGMKFTDAASPTAKDTLDVVYGGKDSQSFSPDATRTGYYLSKFIAKNAGMLEPTLKKTTTHYNPLLRRGEVFLAFAEASNEVWGPTAKGPGCKFSSYDVIKSVRQQSGGITSTTYLDQVAGEGIVSFRKLIQNEVRLEFAFENHRYFDMRRWLLPLNEVIKGVKVTRNEDKTLNYEIVDVENRNMNDVKFYYSPIPYAEKLKNPNLVNNKGW
jgi:hypothetical protein